MTAAITGDGATLLRQICQTPEDDTPRLAFADWCQEQGDSDRATYVRTAIELARCGPPHKKMGWDVAGAHVMRSAGPDYWTFDTGEYHAGEIKVGDRVDVNRYLLSVKQAGRKTDERQKILYGLVVTKVGPQDDYDTVEYTVKRDADSKPWPGTELKKTCDTLLAKYQTRWLFGPKCEKCGGGKYDDCPACSGTGFAGALASQEAVIAHWDRGLVHSLHTTHDRLTRDKGAWASRVWGEWPVTEVRVADKTPYPSSRETPGRRSSWFPRRDVPASSMNDIENANLIDDEVFDLMLEFGEHFVYDTGVVLRTDGHICRFSTADLARAALSRALVKYGRQKAGLDPQ